MQQMLENMDISGNHVFPEAPFKNISLIGSF